MLQLQNNDNINNFTDPEYFSNKIVELRQKLPPILDDFKKYYVFYNKNPDYNEYQQMFENIKSNLNSINSELFMVSNDIDKNQDNLNKKLVKLNIMIREEKQKNRELKRKLGMMEDKNDSTDELISNYKEMYDIAYLRNWGLFLSIIVCGFTISKIFNKKPI